MSSSAGPRFPFALVGLIMVSVGLTMVGFGAAVATIAILVVIIMWHESGHFFAAKLCGVRADRFFAGFGPTVWSISFRGTEYGLKAILLGGFVRVVGMDSATLDDPQGYARTTRPRQWFIVVAGPLMNLLAAFAIMVGLAFTTTFAQSTLTVEEVSGPASEAGMLAGDEMVSLDGRQLSRFRQFADRVADNAGTAVEVEVLRDGSSRIFVVDVPADGFVGVQVSVVESRPDAATAVLFGRVLMLDMVTMTWDGLGHVTANLGTLFKDVFTGNEVSPEIRVVSPIGMVALGSQAAATDWANVWFLIALVNVYLGVFNLLPIPPLDGGHLAVSVTEATVGMFRRHKVTLPRQWVGRFAAAFVMFILSVGLVAIWLDITQPLQGF